MADCELIKGCIFFNDKMPENSAMGRVWKQRYCLGENSKCARYMVFQKLGRERVPKDLYPNMAERADSIVNGAADTEVRVSLGS